MDIDGPAPQAPAVAYLLEVVGACSDEDGDVRPRTRIKRNRRREATPSVSCSISGRPPATSIIAGVFPFPIIYCLQKLAF